MSRREILMVKQNGGLFPASPLDAELLQQVGKEPVLVTVWQSRNPNHHQKFWAIATAVANFDPDFADAEDAAEWAKMHIPNMRSIVVLRDGRAMIRTKSISYASMDQTAFGRFYDRALWLWAEKIKCDPESLLREAAA
jgi:hypothetical protein